MTAAPDILYRQAAALLEQSNSAQALPLLQQAAEQGYTEAAFVLGNHLLQKPSWQKKTVQNKSNIRKINWAIILQTK